MEKVIYLVRHGETVANLTHAFQNLDDPLTEKGVIQAKTLSERLSHVPFDALISSDALRARRTADIIAEKTGHVPETSPLFRELSAPSSLIGISRSDERAKPYFLSHIVNVNEDEYRFEDEESFADLIARAGRALDFLKERPEDALVTVTHGGFLRVLLGAVLFEQTFTNTMLWRMQAAMPTSNTGVTILRLTKRGWNLVTWNDHAHLAE